MSKKTIQEASNLSVKSGWYCPECQEYLSSERVTFNENCDTCGCAVFWVRVDRVYAPIELIEIVVHVGVDFGYGKYAIEEKCTDLAKKLHEEDISR